MKTTRQLLADFATFSRIQLASGDIDPVYPVLRVLYQQQGLSEETALSHTLIYVAYYNLPSALLCVDAISEGRILERLPTGVERRGFRDPLKLGAHFGSLRSTLSAFPSIKEWLQQDFNGDPTHDWNQVQETVQQLWGNGRWAAFKTADLLLNVHGWNLHCPDMGMAHSTGPRHGLALFFAPIEGDTPHVVAQLNYQGERLRDAVNEQLTTPLRIDQLETCLCDFHSLVKGRYAPGHDIDEMQAQIARAYLTHPSANTTLTALYVARRAALPNEWLGEINFWSGPSRTRDTWYRDTGIVLENPKELR